MVHRPARGSVDPRRRRHLECLRAVHRPAAPSIRRFVPTDARRSPNVPDRPALRGLAAPPPPRHGKAPPPRPRPPAPSRSPACGLQRSERSAPRPVAYAAPRRRAQRPRSERGPVKRGRQPAARLANRRYGGPTVGRAHRASRQMPGKNGRSTRARAPAQGFRARLPQPSGKKMHVKT